LGSTQNLSMGWSQTYKPQAPLTLTCDSVGYHSVPVPLHHQGLIRHLARECYLQDPAQLGVTMGLHSRKRD
jgi:hypothetical protein